MEPLTSRYVARKLTRHYYAELAGFLQSFDKSRIESYEPAIADALSEAKQVSWRDGRIKKPTWRHNGDYFFAAVVDRESGTVEAKGIVIGAFLSYAPSGMYGVDLPGETAVVSHVAINEDLLSANPSSSRASSAFCNERRAPAARDNCMCRAALDSALLGFLARRIVSHEFRRDASTLSVKFQTDLVPAYTGDAHRWLSLCRWYLDLSFGPFVKPSETDPSDKDQTIQQIEFDITPACRPGMVQTPEHLAPLEEHLHKVPLNAIVVPTPDFYEDLVDEIQKHHRRDRHNIAFVDQRHGGGDPELKFDIPCEIVYRNRLEEALKDVKGLYFDSRSKPLQMEWWDRWLRLKLGLEQSDRSGMIVEIDREGYEALLVKLTGATKPERLLFLNDGGFGETARADCSVYFYVWDAYGAAADPSRVPGVIAARGRLAEAKAWSLKQLNSNWPEFSKYTIWPEPFAEQYFDDRVVGFFIDEIECITGMPNGGSFPGVSYDGILRHVFQRLQTDNIAPEALQFQEEMLPSWDIKNTYLDEDLSTAINEELRSRANTSLKALLSKPKPPHTGLVEVKQASEPRLTAAHWITREPKRSQEPPPDVFLSFSGIDETGGQGWKSEVMRSFSGSLTAKRYQKPYAFDEETKRDDPGN